MDVKQSTGKVFRLSNPYIFAIILGILAQLTLLANLTVHIKGGILSIAPNEIFATIAGALAGPLAGLISAILASTLQQPDFGTFYGIFVRIIATVWMAYGYRYIYLRLKPAPRLAAWMGLISVYYFGIFAILYSVPFYLIPEMRQEMFGGGSYPEVYLAIAGSVAGEFIMTAVFSGLIMLALPRRFQRPLWLDLSKQNNTADTAMEHRGAA